MSHPDTERRHPDEPSHDEGDHLDDNILTLIGTRSASVHEREYVRDHIAHCPDCRELVQATFKLFAEPEIIERPWWRDPRVAAAAALAAGILVMGWYFDRNAGGPRPGGPIEPAARGVIAAIAPRKSAELVQSIAMGGQEGAEPAKGAERTPRSLKVFPEFDGRIVVLWGSKGTWTQLRNGVDATKDKPSIYFGLREVDPGDVLVAVTADIASTPLEDTVREAGLPQGDGAAAVDAWKPKLESALSRSGHHKVTVETVPVP